MYPERRSSGIDWLGDLPSHWAIRRLKSCIRLSINGTWGDDPRNDENDLVCVRVADFDYEKFRVSTEKLTIRNIASADQLTRRLQPGDLLIEKSGGGDLQPVGRVVRFDLPQRAVCSNFIGRLVAHEVIDDRFLNYVFFAMYSAGLNTRSIKQTTGIQNLDLDSYQSERFGLPPHDEQQAIVTFLDRETARIDALIAKKRQLIECLQEQRIALLSQAVTKGLDSRVPMSDSGIPWLGTIPAHWDMPRLKFLSKVQTGLTLGHDYGRRETVSKPYLRVANVQDGFLDLTTITTVQIPREEVPRYELQKDDVLMTEGGDFDKLGRGYVWDGQIESCLHQNHIFAVRCNPNKLDPYFLDILTTSLHGKNYFTRVSRQTTNLATINQTTLGDFPVPLPPIEEQKAIRAYIRELTGRLDALIMGVRTGIVQLHEYRSALISAAITGKIDVRGAVV